MNSTDKDLPDVDTPSEDPAKDSKHPPANTTPNKSATTPDMPEFGWSTYAERVNGRFAMIGFAAILLIEVLSQDIFLHWAGLVP